MTWGSRFLRISFVPALTVVAGCSGPALSPPPLSMRSETAYVEAVPADLQGGSMRVLYATDRKAREGRPPSSRYTANRGHTLALGVATVRFGGEEWSWDELASKTGAGAAVPLKITELEEFGVLGSTVRTRLGEEQEPFVDGVPAFARELDQLLAASGESTVTVFVHGFNTGFPWAIEVAASMWHLGGRHGAVIAYSWPSHDTFIDYAEDRETGAITARALREFLLMLAEETSVERINVLTYSAGAPTVVSALHQMRLIFADEEPDEIRQVTKLAEIVFSGADVDRDALATSLLDRMQDVAKRINIYTSRIDAGLGMSNLFFFSDPRLGRAERSLSPEARLELRNHSEINVIDVTRAQDRAGRGDIWAHGYWYGNAWVSNDLLCLLLTGADPQERGLEQAPDSGVWTFPKDYPERVAGGAGALPRSNPATPAGGSQPEESP